MVFDPTVLAALPMVADGSNVAFAQRLLKLHDISCAAALEEIEAALAAGDTARMRERLHGLKSSSAQVGALALAALAAGFEQQLRDQQAPAAAWLAQLRQAHRELQQARGPVPDTSI
jgi:HPt (histidine-containing phosphotransfer) domain-containing protein